MSSFLAFYAFAIGAVVGSFLNVVIHRYPREESIVFPASHCPHCGKNIRWFDNVPVVSWLLLRGRCRNCRGPIALRYPLVELANGLFYLALFLRTGVTVAFIPLAAIVSMTIALIYIDAEIQILPDAIDLPGMAIGLLVGWLQAGLVYPRLMLAESLTDSLIGAALGAGVILAIIGGYWLLRRVEGMGFGDVKMLAMIGAVVGWRAVFGVLVLASIAGALIAIPFAVRSEKGMQLALPFGVFLGIAVLAVIFFGPALAEWYLAVLVR
jgi:leader peptidase (prepilin peptidase)/N-methyltransferase